MPDFAIGDRVQITEQYPHDGGFRGATGTVIPRPEGFVGITDMVQCWVEFDTPIASRNNCFSVSGAFWPTHLRHIDRPRE
jgi:hypothetical protein